MTLVAKLDPKLCQFDVEIVLLNDELKETIYIVQGVLK